MPDSATSNTPAVVITGASSGIGRACTAALDRRGWRVFAGVRREEDARRVAEGLSPRFTPLLLDVTDAAQIEAAAKRVEDEAGEGGLAGLVNNAGVAVFGPLELVDLDDLRRQIEVNVTGQVAVIQRFLPLLRAAKGRIVNIGSITGRVASPYFGPYAISKFALEAISDVLRIELRRWGISVSLVEPGSVATPMWDKAQDPADRFSQAAPPEAQSLYGEDLAAMDKAVERLSRRGMPPERVARAVVHALTARRPRTRYPLGLQTRLALATFPLMQARHCDWFVRKTLGLS